MNNEIVLYKAVSVDIEPPENIRYHVRLLHTDGVIENAVSEYFYGWHDDGHRQGEEKVIEYLLPLPNHVPISVERLEALDKCVEALKWYADSDNYLAINNIGSTLPQRPFNENTVIATAYAQRRIENKAKQALSNLSTTKQVKL